MNEFIALTCPTCGGKLEIGNGIERFACSYCGNEHLVNRQGNIVYLSPVVDGLQSIQVGTDKTASELAIVRLNKEINEIGEAIKNVRQKIVYALSYQRAEREIRDILASRRKPYFEKRSFIKSANINDYVMEINNLPHDEFEQLQGKYPKSVTLKMIRTNLETIRGFEKAKINKKNQLKEHQQVVDFSS